MLSPSAEGYAKEQIFLTKLSQHKRQFVTAAPYPGPALSNLLFSFERVRLVWGFAVATQAVEKYNEYAVVVLFLPRKSNEPFIDAAIYDYQAKAIYAIQVLICRGMSAWQ